MRQRRLSQLEEYVGRVEAVVREKPKVTVLEGVVLDAEVKALLAQLEEEVDWGEPWEQTHAALHAQLADPQRLATLRSLLDTAFGRYDLDGDGAVRAPPCDLQSHPRS